MKIQVVVGAQFGSEAKGHVTAQLIQREVDTHNDVVNVRVAGPNAGHSVVDLDGTKWALRQVPVGAVIRGRVALGIAAGSEIDLPVLLDEIDRLRDARLLAGSNLMVDAEATIVTGMHKLQETGMHERMGSTGKGIGAARADRIMRTAQRLKDNNDAMRELYKRNVKIGDVADSIREISQPRALVIEGTQGYGLGLHAGYYPHCTSSDCRAVDFLSMTGISPWEPRVDKFEVWAVARVYPIRVAGTSGPLRNETSWEALGLEPEFTTVTKKMRRVGAWDGQLVNKATRANGGAPIVRLALTMIDQLNPEAEGETNPHELLCLDKVNAFVSQVEADANARVRMVTTSDRTAVWL